jgi:hypothetical protein
LADEETSANKRSTTGAGVRWIALAGIVATAVVGLAGAASSWLIARQQDATNRSLAHDAQVYDRRANAYLAAISLIERQRNLLSFVARRAETENSVREKPTNPLIGVAYGGADSKLVFARVVAFGSPGIVAAYKKLGGIAFNFYGAETDFEFSLYEQCGPNRQGKMYRCLQGKARQKEIFAAITKFYAISGTFDKAATKFQLMVHKELA